MVGRTFKLWWSENGDKVGGTGVMVKEELCEKEVNYRVMIMVLTSEEDVMRLTCGLRYLLVRDEHQWFPEVYSEMPDTQTVAGTYIHMD